jgi:hypothetical protein
MFRFRHFCIYLRLKSFSVGGLCPLWTPHQGSTLDQTHRSKLCLHFILYLATPWWLLSWHIILFEIRKIASHQKLFYLSFQPFYLMKFVPETRRGHLIWYLCFYFTHLNQIMHNWYLYQTNDFGADLKSKMTTTTKEHSLT